MARRMLLLLAVCLTGLTLVAAGCGGSDNESASEDTTATLTTTTEETTTEETTTEETTTEEESTTDTETTEESTDTSSSTDFATSENCREFAQVGAKISESLTGSSDVSDIKEAFSQYASAAPDDIKDDFQTLADFFGEVANAVGNLQAGDTPSPEDLAALQSLDSSAATQASQNIQTWVQENCTS